MYDCVNGFWTAYFTTGAFANVFLILNYCCTVLAFFLVCFCWVKFFFLFVCPSMVSVFFTDFYITHWRFTISQQEDLDWSIAPDLILLKPSHAQNLITNFKTTTKKKHCIWMLIITNHALGNACMRNLISLYYVVRSCAYNVECFHSLNGTY